MPPLPAYSFPFLLLFPLLISSTPPPPPSPPLPPTENSTLETAAEISALNHFRRTLQDPLGALSGWDPSGPGAPCSWRGVICYPSVRRVMELRLPRLRLAGKISDRLCSLFLLRRLSLRSNLLTGPIPSSFSRLPRLRFLFLQHNFLSGPLPSNLSALQVFSAAGNFLSGYLPSSLPPDLRFLDLSSNSFSGPIPSNFTYARRLQFLDLSFNRLTGTLPGSLGLLQLLLYLQLDGNLLEGTIPSAIANCSSLLFMSLQGNGLRGILPEAVAGIPTLQILSLSGNHLSGSIPSSILCNSSALRILQLGDNYFSNVASPAESRAQTAGSASFSVLEVLDLKENGINGQFPRLVFNISTLVVLDLSGNSFSGSLSPEIGRLSALRELRVGRDSLTGTVPPEIVLCASLRVIDLELNRFSGAVPAVLGELISLTNLYLGGNLFSGQIPANLGNLSELESLSVYGNRLSGQFPDELTRLESLTILDVSDNTLFGEIPATIGNLRRLESLNLSHNSFCGGIPAGIGSLSSLKMLDLSAQKNLSGELPPELFGLPILKLISLAANSFSGDVPEGFSSLWSLEELYLSSNFFSGAIPVTYGYLPSLQVLSLAGNHISGEIPPQLSNCSNLTALSLRSNQLSGAIPGDLSKLSNLVEIDLGRNHISGNIPPEISRCSSLTILQLDENQLSGEIPSSLARIPSLIHLNLSSNDLQGEIPASLGSRFNDPSAFEDNPNLCGQPLEKVCSGERKRRRRKKTERLALLIGLPAVAAVSLALMSFCCVFTLLRWRKRVLDRRNGVKKRSPGRGSGGENGGGPKLVMFNSKITYAETVDATRNFEEENVLNRGRHGLLFKACFNDGSVLSVLRLPATSLGGEFAVDAAAFRKEAESLGKVKHRNLMVLRGYYPGPPADGRLLVYDYMPNGTLTTLLQEACRHGGHVLNWPMRHLIALGVARGLAQLHASGIIHGDVNPQNVLFDADFEPHITEFGLERLAAAEVSTSAAAVGTVGYAAPEAATAGRGTTEGDVYSFGIVVLELLTGKGPGMFAGEEEEDMVKWVKRQLQHGAVTELLEPGLVELDPQSSDWEEFLLGVKVGLLCTAPDPASRPAMADVVFMLEGCRVGPDIPSSGHLTTCGFRPSF
ncbi:putative LRR receptor-like serine/threonine-protein kinase [Apostasia shenzhenica]|uniref:Putative LRR receptor-like serine/threonine-protein kinase n=1 Tax=Apostasia shenzhenica TaxID=1088818 RepID=A0A2I0AY32_9ASPA|nr:putative LRR receptor-like serine/threonine-protein kinase [Apostasia shenzhenica]